MNWNEKIDGTREQIERWWRHEMRPEQCDCGEH